MSRAQAAPGRWDGLIVLVAANSWDSTKVADQHMAEQLSKLAPVLYVDPPVASRVPRLRGRQLGCRLVRLTPEALPMRTRPWMAPVTARLMRAAIRDAAARLGGSVLAVVTAQPHFPVFGCCREQVRVFWAQDDYVGGASLLGLSPELVARSEQKVAASADLLVASSPAVQQTWQGRGYEPRLITFGVDAGAFGDVESAPLPRMDFTGRAAGFFGRLNGRTDLALLEAVADRMHLVLAGAIDRSFEPGRVAALLRRSSVTWLGEVPWGDIPGCMRAIDVGLVPYRTDDAFNRGSFPLKTLEYLAAGRPVVATDLPAIRWLGTDLITVADGPDPFARQAGLLLAQERTPALAQSRRQFAQRHSWASRADDILRAIDEHHGTGQAITLSSS